MFRIVMVVILICFINAQASASGGGQTIKQIYYCGDDFAMKMSGGDWYLAQKSRLGEQKLNHFLSIALFMMASGKETANVFPKDPVAWCGISGVRPIAIFSVVE